MIQNICNSVYYKSIVNAPFKNCFRLCNVNQSIQ